jgi:hypothetical protein
LNARELPVEEIADRFGVSRSTLHRNAAVPELSRYSITQAKQTAPAGVLPSVRENLSVLTSTPVRSLLLLMQKAKKGAIEATEARYADRIARLKEAVANKLAPPPALPDSNNGAASSAKRHRVRAPQRKQNCAVNCNWSIYIFSTRFNPDLWHFIKLEEKTSGKAAVNFSLASQELIA